MTRTPRLEQLGLPYHVIVQGINRCAIFIDDSDRSRFVRRAIRIFREMGIVVIAWALMGNHVHFVLRSTEGQLGKAMQRLLGSHALRFNRRHGRVGRLFRDRFWSRPVESDEDLLRLIAYVLLNPLRAGVVEDLEALAAYPWTSLSELVRPGPAASALVDRTAALIPFGDDEATALRTLLEFLAATLDDDEDGTASPPPLPESPAALPPRVRKELLASATYALMLRSERIDAVLDQREERAAICLRLESRNWTLDDVVVRAARLCGVSPHCVRGGRRSRPQSRARGLVAYFAATYLGQSDAAIARAVGIARQSVRRARRRGIEEVDRLGLDWRRFFGIDDDSGAAVRRDVASGRECDRG